jgi:glycosyltransferase involved in cell wall biosynthesis
MVERQKVIKVAQVLAGAAQGGAENFYTRIVCELAKESTLSQCAFTRPHSEREFSFSNAGVSVNTFKFGSAVHWLDHSKFRKALRKYKPDIVLTYMNRATSITPKGSYKLVARLGHYYDLKYYRHCDYWIGITKGICDYLIGEGLPADKVFHIPNFVNEVVAEPLSRASFNTPKDVPILFALGRLHTHKGFDILVQALAKAKTDAVLWLAGDGPEKANLQALVKELNLEQRVKFLGWRSDVNALMSTADLFICPSRHEGLGSIIIEAWFNRCPMIATASQGPKELITHEKNALLTPIDDVDSLTLAMESLLNDPNKAALLAEQGFAEYKTLYSRDIIIKQYLDLFKTLAG